MGRKANTKVSTSESEVTAEELEIQEEVDEREKAAAKLAKFRNRPKFTKTRTAKLLLALYVLDGFVSCGLVVLPEDRMLATQSMQQLAYIQSWLAYISLGLSVLCMFILLQCYYLGSIELIWVNAALKTIQLLFDVLLIGLPTPTRLLMGFVGMISRLMQFLMTLYLAYKSQKNLTSKLRPPQVLLSLLDMKPQDHNGSNHMNVDLMERIEELVLPPEFKKYSGGGGRSNLISFGVIVLALSVVNFAIEIAKLETGQDSFFSISELDNMRMWSNMPMYWPSRSIDGPFVFNKHDSGLFPRTYDNVELKPLPNNDMSVVIVLLDGLVSAEEYTRFFEFSKLANFTRDSLAYTAESHVPTTSLANFVALVSGVTPEFSGIFGDHVDRESFMDNLFNLTKNFNLKSGLTAESRVASMIKSTMPLLHSDGTVATFSDATASDATKDEVDEIRAEVLEMALDLQEDDKYRFFICQFSDIDVQAAHYGADDQWNNHDATDEIAGLTGFDEVDAELSLYRNSYKAAIYKKWSLVSKLIEKQVKRNDNTLFIFTSEHGQSLPRGGHGGSQRDVVEVPLVFYKHGSRLATLNATHTEHRFVETPTSLPGFENPWGNQGDCNPTIPWRPGGNCKVKLVDVATTVAALLGLPVPRQSLGVFIDDLMPLAAHPWECSNGTNTFKQDSLFEENVCISGDVWKSQQYRIMIHYRDLMRQKQAFVNEWLIKVGASDRYIDNRYLWGDGDWKDFQVSSCDSWDPLNTFMVTVNQFDLEEGHTLWPFLEGGKCSREKANGDGSIPRGDYVEAKYFYISTTKQLLSIMESERLTRITTLTTRNYVYSMMICAVVIAVFVAVMQVSTHADPISLGVCTRADFVRPYMEREDTIALGWALGCHALHYLFGMMLVYLIMALTGFVGFDVTILYNPLTRVNFFLLATLPSVLSAYVFTCYYMFRYRRPTDLIARLIQNESKWEHRLHVFLGFWFVTTPVKDIGVVYMCRIYFLLVSLLAGCVLLVLMSHYTFIVPIFYNVPYIEELQWDTRFRLLTAQLINLPMLLNNVIMLWLWQKHPMDSMAIIELYTLLCSKEERVVGGFLGDSEVKEAEAEISTTAAGGGEKKAKPIKWDQSREELRLENKLSEARLEKEVLEKQVEDLQQQVDTFKSNKTNEMDQTKMQAEFVSKGFRDLEGLLKSGFHSLEHFYKEQHLESLRAEQEALAQQGDVDLTEVSGRGGQKTNPTAVKVARSMMKEIDDLDDAHPGMGGALNNTIDVMKNEAKIKKELLEVLFDLEKEDGRARDELRTAMEKKAEEKQKGWKAARAKLLKDSSSDNVVREVAVAALVTDTMNLSAPQLYMKNAKKIITRLHQAKELKSQINAMQHSKAKTEERMEALREEITFQQDVVVERDTKLIRSSAKVDMLEEQLVKAKNTIFALNNSIAKLESRISVIKSQQTRENAKIAMRQQMEMEAAKEKMAQVARMRQAKNDLFNELQEMEQQLAISKAEREEALIKADKFRNLLSKAV